MATPAVPDKNRALAGGLDGDSNREKKRQQKHQASRRADQVEVIKPDEESKA